jgi:hypothetical protein
MVLDKIMGSTFRFISAPDSPASVLEWFRALPTPPEEVPTDRGTVLYFRSCGNLSLRSDGSIITDESPVATLFLPRIRRGVLWTVGELHFLPKRISERFPELAKVSGAFSRWLKRRPCIYSNKSLGSEFDYYLEGSIRNFDSPVYAFECGLAALRSGRYLVGDGDNELVLDKLCQILRLRGIECLC